MSMDSSTEGYEDAVFISYTHVDNLPFGADHLCWITHLHEQLTCRVEQLYSEDATVWRDEKLHGNDVFEASLVERLESVAVIVSVCSPRHLHSEWCRRELDEFVHAAEAGLGMQVGTKEGGVFKVLKTPVPVDEQPEPLRSLLGYEFYEESPTDHRVREYLPTPRRTSAGSSTPASTISPRTSPGSSMTWATTSVSSDGDGRPVAPSTWPRRRRTWLPTGTTCGELERRAPPPGAPTQRAPLFTVEALTAAVDEDLSRADMAIHLVGSRYGARPEDDDRSIPHLQLELAGALAARAGLVQLIWLPEGLEPIDDDQRTLVTELQEAEIGSSVEVVRGRSRRSRRTCSTCCARRHHHPSSRRRPATASVCTSSTIGPTARPSAPCRPSSSDGVTS